MINLSYHCLFPVEEFPAIDWVLALQTFISNKLYFTLQNCCIQGDQRELEVFQIGSNWPARWKNNRSFSLKLNNAISVATKQQVVEHRMFEFYSYVLRKGNFTFWGHHMASKITCFEHLRFGHGGTWIHVYSLKPNTLDKLKEAIRDKKLDCNQWWHNDPWDDWFYANARKLHLGGLTLPAWCHLLLIIINLKWPLVTSV